VIQDSQGTSEFYGRRTAEHQQRSERLARSSLHISNLRGLTFVVFGVAEGFAMFGHGGWPATIVGLVGLLCFVWLVAHHARLIKIQEREERWVRVNRDAAARVTENDWHELPQTGDNFRDPKHPYADDLDIFGKASLFQRLNVAQTHLGQRLLAEWLKAPADNQEVLRRQHVIQTLSAKFDLRQNLEVLSLGTREASRKNNVLRDPEDPEPFLAWAEEKVPGNLTRYSLFAWGLPLATLVSVLLASGGWAPASMVLLPIGASLWTLARVRARMRSLLRMLHTAERTVGNVSELFALLEQNARLFGFAEVFSKTGTQPSSALAALGRVGSWFELRHNGLIYPFVDAALLWDVHCWLGFERWRLRHGHALREWFSAVGEAEALSSLAGFGFDEPFCCVAHIDDSSPGFEATALGHPLIHPAKRIANDVTGLQPGHGLLVTGSNMSGKSTYLRAVGLGCVLGLAGGYVCAKQLRLCRTQLATSMRISDNLATGVSHFYAELQKLKGLLDATQGSLPVLFLLDEVLHGTNSLERQVGARYLIAELLRAGAFGAVSTHDSALCELSGELVGRLQLVHFRESVAGGEMTFDYRLYPGPVKAGNALRLMQKLGIAVPIA